MKSIRRRSPLKSTLKVADIYQHVKRYWPEQVDVSDAEHIDEDGMKSENLSAAWYNAELKASDEWENKMVWSMYVLLHRQMKDGQKKVSPRNLEITGISNKFRAVLRDAGLIAMLKQID